MRVVKLTWNQKVNANSNLSLQTEVLIDDDSDAEQAGRDALTFLDSFLRGIGGQAAENEGSAG